MSYRIDSYGAHENNNFQATDEIQHYKWLQIYRITYERKGLQKYRRFSKY